MALGEGLQLGNLSVLVVLRDFQLIEGDAFVRQAAQELLSLLGSADIAGCPSIEFRWGLPLFAGGAPLVAWGLKDLSLQFMRKRCPVQGHVGHIASPALTVTFWGLTFSDTIIWVFFSFYPKIPK